MTTGDATESIGTKVARGTVWVLTGNLASRFLAVIAVSAFARMLGKAGFGYYGIITALVLTAGALIGGPFGVTVTRYTSMWKTDEPTQCGKTIGMALVVATGLGAMVALVLVAFAGPIARGILNQPEAESALRLAAPYVVAGSLIAVGNGVLSGYRAFRVQARINVSASVALLLAAPMALLLDVNGAVVAFVVAGTLHASVLLWQLSAESRTRGIQVLIRGLSSVRHVIGEFTLPAFLSGLLAGPVAWIGTVLLVRSPGGAVQTGLFAAANYLRGLVLLIPGALAIVMLPVLVESLTADKEHFRRVGVLNTKLMALFAFPLSTMLAVGSKGIVGVIYGAEYSEAWAALALLAASSGFVVVGSAIGQVFSSKARMWTALAVNGVTAIVFLALASFLVGEWGALGLAFATLLAYVLNMIVLLLVRAKSLSVPWTASEVGVLVLAATLTALALALAAALTPLNSLVLGPIYGFAVIALLYITGFSRKERSGVLRRLRIWLRQPRGNETPDGSDQDAAVDWEDLSA